MMRTASLLDDAHRLLLEHFKDERVECEEASLSVVMATAQVRGCGCVGILGCNTDRFSDIFLAQQFLFLDLQESAS